MKHPSSLPWVLVHSGRQIFHQEGISRWKQANGVEGSVARWAANGGMDGEMVDDGKLAKRVMEETKGLVPVDPNGGNGGMEDSAKTARQMQVGRDPPKNSSL